MDSYIVPRWFIDALLSADGETGLELIEQLQTGLVEIQPCNTSKPLDIEVL